MATNPRPVTSRDHLIPSSRAGAKSPASTISNPTLANSLGCSWKLPSGIQRDAPDRTGMNSTTINPMSTTR